MSDIENTMNESALSSLNWDHLYAIDIEGSHLLADQLEVNRFEEVVADVLDSPDIHNPEPMLWPISDWDYNEEHAYPLRPQISTVNPECIDVSCQTTNQPNQLSIDLNAIKILFGEAEMELILPNPVIQSRNMENEQPCSLNVIKSIKGSLETILSSLIDISQTLNIKQSNIDIKQNSEVPLVNSPCTCVLVHLPKNSGIERTSKTRHLVVYQCPNDGCSQRSYQVGSLLNHIKLCKHGKGSQKDIDWAHQCSQCDRQFSDLFSLKRHLNSVHHRGRDAATQFPETFVSGDDRGSSPTGQPSLQQTGHNLAYSRRNKTAEAALELKETINQGALRPRPSWQRFICSTCGSSFNRLDSLTNHREYFHSSTITADLSNTNLPVSIVPKFACKYCGKLFSRKSRLTDHQLGTHENQKRFWCSLCPPGKSCGYKNRLYLRMHQRKCHENSAPKFSCPFCFKCLSSKFYLKKHLSSQHSNYQIK